jgi:hypothetical protein
MRERNSIIEENKEVVVKDDDNIYTCQLTDISANGISVTTEHFIPTFKEIEIIMDIDGKKASLKGSARWSIDPGTTIDRKGKSGIFLMDPPPEFQKYVKMREKK